jgi:hypothetical protein
MVEENLPVRVGPPSEDKSFEQLKSVNEHGAEYWSARDLQPRLGYRHWRNFEKAIAKAITSCQQSGNDPDHHFARARKMIALGKGGQRDVDDYWLSRFACYLIAQNGDPRKPEIALAQKSSASRQGSTRGDPADWRHDAGGSATRRGHPAGRKETARFPATPATRRPRRQGPHRTGTEEVNLATPDPDPGQTDYGLPTTDVSPRNTRTTRRDGRRQAVGDRPQAAQSSIVNHQ